MILIYIGVQVCLTEVISGARYDFTQLTTLPVNGLLVITALAIVYLIIGRLPISMFVVEAICGLLALVNHYYSMFRGAPFELIDALSAGTAAAVIGGYDLSVDTEVFLWILLSLSVLGSICLMQRRHLRSRISMGSAGLVMVIGVIFAGLYTHHVDYWDLNRFTRQLGYLNSVLTYGKIDLSVRQPAGYSQEAVTEILENYSAQDLTEQPDIIVVMNESWADLPVAYQFTTNTDGMPFIHSLNENTIKGTMLSSVYGGSTAVTEWEFLTGGTTAFLSSGCNPYVQYVRREEESLASELVGNGYRAIAFHPEQPTNYHRNTVYPYLGFEQFYSIQDDLADTTILRGNYMADSADVHDLIDIYEQNVSDEPLFLFNVTMQNHGGYSWEESEIPVTVSAADEDLQYVQLDEYLSMIRETDCAFEELVTYYEQVDRPTIILMFGDHEPGVSSELLEAMKGHYHTVAGEGNGMEQYQVPFVLWANYDIEEDNDVLISPGFLRAYLLDKAGIALGSYDQFLLDCHESIIAINAFGYYDAEGAWHTLQDIVEDSILSQYQILQYGKLFDKEMDATVY